MSQQVSWEESEASPKRDKRRQSDAKWRASVATCYDALKYVVPNVKNLPKKKISKALILQECEKHIKSLEDTIGNLLHSECQSQGLVAVWKDGGQWFQCSLDKLRTDFSDKQRKVFHMSAHGRRCYNLLQDIKDEVFNMRANPEQMTFIPEDSFSLFSTERFTDCTGDVATVPTMQYPGGYSQLDHVPVSFHYSPSDKNFMQSTCGTNTDFTHEVKQEWPQGVPDNRWNKTDYIETLYDDWGASSTQDYDTCKSVKLVRADLVSEDPTPHTDQCVPSRPAPALVATTPARSGRNGTTLPHASLTQGQTVSKIYILPKGLEYSYLLKALDVSKDQVVPSTQSTHIPAKTVRIKRLRQSSCSSETGFQAFPNGNTSDESRGNAETKNSTVSTSRLLVDSLIKVEPQTLSPCDSHDPLLSSFHTPTLDPDLSMFSWTNSCEVTKKPAKQSLARKRLNFGGTPLSKYGDTSLNLVSPDESVGRSPMLTGFTPVKLPDGFNLTPSGDHTLDSLVSPWKALGSPFDSIAESQNFASACPVDIENSLLCFETMEGLDLEDSLGTEITPVQGTYLEINQEVEDVKKERISPHWNGSQERGELKCRRQLDRFYDLSALEEKAGSSLLEDHQVPDIDMTSWLPSTDHTQAQDLENCLI